jgi:sulfur relay (sulfurtransferase) DsrC/TusE family protein
MIASHLALNCGKIAKMKPEFEPQITTKLLKIDSTSHSTEHKELIKSYIIEAFYSYFHQSLLKREIINFIREQINSDSNKTRKIAKKILMELDN